MHTLRVAWVFRTGELGQGVKDWKRSAFEATPILHDGVLYLTTSATDVLFSILSRGFFSSTTKSASLPGSMEPRS